MPTTRGGSSTTGSTATIKATKGKRKRDDDDSDYEDFETALGERRTRATVRRVAGTMAAGVFPSLFIAYVLIESILISIVNVSCYMESYRRGTYTGILTENRVFRIGRWNGVGLLVFWSLLLWKSDL